eukprot:Trichotokara_eunicae@DN6302_c1_g1_i5.p1
MALLSERVSERVFPLAHLLDYRHSFFSANISMSTYSATPSGYCLRANRSSPPRQWWIFTRSSATSILMAKNSSTIASTSFSLASFSCMLISYFFIMPSTVSSFWTILVTNM